MVKKNSNEDYIRDLELIDWVDEEEGFRTVALRDGKEVEAEYITFEDVLNAILEHGPLVSASPVADVLMFALEGEYDGCIMAVRHSGRNIRRILLRAETFEISFCNFQGCLNHIKSNNFVESELEISHLFAMAQKLDLSPTDFDPERDYNRLEVDIIAALQLMEVEHKILKETKQSGFLFELGYSVGRLFSSAQNLATLEDDARMAAKYRQSYSARGKMGKSATRKRQRLDDLFDRIHRMVEKSPQMSRFKPIVVAKVAAEDAANENPELWSQGLGQIETYLTIFASDETYKCKYREIFPETG